MKAPASISLPFAVAILLIPASFAWSYFHDAATQDGPSHLAAAKIANDWVMQSLGNTRPGAVFETYRLQFEPVPNWSGQALGMALCATLPIHLAEILMNLAGVWIPAMSLAWLVVSIRNAGSTDESEWAGTIFHALWISTLATNVLWTFGFTSFLLGLGMAWFFLGRLLVFARSGGCFRWFTLTLFWCATFVCHLVAFAIGGVIAGCLLLFYPGWSIARRVAIAVSLGCAAPLWLRYRNLTGGSAFEPIWEHLSGSELLSVSNWARQFGWIDPLSLHTKSWHPFTGDIGAKGLAFQPGVWIAVASSAVVFEALRRRFIGIRNDISKSEVTNRIPGGAGHFEAEKSGEPLNSPKRIARFAASIRQRRLPEWFGFVVAGSILAILGTIGPDSLGAQQGHYLPQRFCLAALCLVPLILSTVQCRVSSISTGFLAIAWVLQTAGAIDFARSSHHLTQPVRAEADSIHPGDRILALIDAVPWPYRSNPRLHADALLVQGADDVASWNLYEAAHPYFPLRFRSMVPEMEPAALEAYSLAVTRNDPAIAEQELDSILSAAEGRATVVAILTDRSSPRRIQAEKVLSQRAAWRKVTSGPECLIYRGIE
ncbi:hypothetical protein GC170_11135 [bacterium]|nr:hypothetical protein [bacterium]